MSIADDITQARAAAVELLTDTVELQRADAEPDTDKWGSTTPRPGIVYTGPALLQDTASNRQGLVFKAGETIHDGLGYVLKLPVTVDVRTGDWATVTDSLDPRHVGRRVRVVAVPTQAWAVLHRCIVDPDEQALA